MRRNAVLLTVLFAFAITLVTVTYIFWESYKSTKQQYIDSIFNKYNVITQIYREHMMKHTSEAILEANLAVYGLNRIEDAARVKNVSENAEVLKRTGFQEVVSTMLFSPKAKAMIKRQRVKDLRASMLEFKHQIYFYIESPQNVVLLHDKELKPFFPTQLVSAYLTIVIVIFFAIFIILQSIRPLRQLTRKAKRYAEGDRAVSFAMQGQSEIAVLANTLELARENINLLIEARTLFLRNVMHELKTPIAKGRISAEMVKDEKQKARFKSIFIRLEKLINEFAMIEEISSGFGKGHMGEYRLVDLLDEAVDQAMVEHSQVRTDLDSSKRVKCDFSKMATAMKNMIDNGIKYSPDKAMRIFVTGQDVVFENSGEKLTHPIAYYTEPFTKEHPTRDSFGLGLYLVDAILKLHGMALAYDYADGKNRFIFKGALVRR